jgi:hypothetical protein
MNAPGVVTIVGLALMLFSAPPVALAQQQPKVYRIGVLSTGGPAGKLHLDRPARATA